MSKNYNEMDDYAYRVAGSVGEFLDGDMLEPCIQSSGFREKGNARRWDEIW